MLGDASKHLRYVPCRDGILSPTDIGKLLSLLDSLSNMPVAAVFGQSAGIVVRLLIGPSKNCSEFPTRCTVCCELKIPASPPSEKQHTSPELCHTQVSRLTAHGMCSVARVAHRIIERFQIARVLARQGTGDVFNDENFWRHSSSQCSCQRQEMISFVIHQPLPSG